MKLERALKLNKGDVVGFPPDRGTYGGLAIIKYAGKYVQQSYKGVDFVWITFEQGGTWPSNRLI